MSDLISRQDAIEAVATVTMSIHLSNVLCDKLLALPPADAVEVVRCGECKHRDEKCGMGEHRWCEVLKMSTRADDYCSYGERREP